MKNKEESTLLKQQSFKRSPCPLACTLDLVGDKWTLLIIRDLLFGKRRYGEFMASREGITTNILADRLQKMEAAGLISKTPYQEKPVRHEYTLTSTGEALSPVVWSIVEWANQHIPETYIPKRPA